jgi:hypothetical protein
VRHLLEQAWSVQSHFDCATALARHTFLLEISIEMRRRSLAVFVFLMAVAVIPVLKLVENSFGTSSADGGQRSYSDEKAGPVAAREIAFAGGPARGGKSRTGSLTRLQSIRIGEYAYHISGLLTPEQSLVRVGDYVVTVGGTAGGIAYDCYERARVYRIRADGTLSLARVLSAAARTLALRDNRIYSICFDPDPLIDEKSCVGGLLNTHLEVFEFSSSDGQFRRLMKRKPPVSYTRFLRGLALPSEGIAMVETLRPGNSVTATVDLISNSGDKLLARHRFKKRSLAEELRMPTGEILSLSGNSRFLAARTISGRILFLDSGASLKPKGELKLIGIGAIMLDGSTLFVYKNRGVLEAYDVSNPGAPVVLWSRSIPRVPNVKGIVLDGERVLVHGSGLTEIWLNDSRPPTYFRVNYAWTTLECVIPNGDLIYAFNGAASVSKLMVLRMIRPD